MARGTVKAGQLGRWTAFRVRLSKWAWKLGLRRLSAWLFPPGLYKRIYVPVIISGLEEPKP